MSPKRLLTKKLSVILIIFSMVLALFIMFDSSNIVHSESLESIYEQIRDKYPDEIKTMKKYGATDGDIESFVNALEEKMRQEDNITEENVDDIVVEAAIDLFTDSDDYIAIFDAVSNGWNLNIWTLIDAYGSGGKDKVKDMLPKSFLEIGSLVKAEIIDPPNSDPGTVPGGSSGGGEPQEENIVIADSSDISRQLTSEGTSVVIPIASNQSSVGVKNSDLVKVIAAGKSLEIKTALGDVVFTIPVQTLKIFMNVGLEITAKKLTTLDAHAITKNLSSGSKRVSSIYEFDLKGSSGVNSTNTYFDVPVEMSLSYGESFLTLTEEDNLAVYRYDEEKEQWLFIGGTVDKNEKTLIWQASHFSKYTILSGGPGKTFNDIIGHWAKNDIEYLATRDIVNGVKEDIFEPNRRVTRAEFVKMLVNILNIEIVDSANNKFADVPENSWYAQYVIAAYHAGLVNGVSETNFAPNSPITRQEMAVMAINSLNMKDKIVVQEQKEELKFDQFQDASEIAGWAKDACITALENGIIQGRGVGVFAPRNYTTRAESAVIINRILSKL